MEEQQQSSLGQPPTHAADVRVPTSEQEAAKAEELAEARQEHLDRTAGVAQASPPVESTVPDEPEQPQPVQPSEGDQQQGDSGQQESGQQSQEQSDQSGESSQTQESGSEDTGGGDGTTGDNA